MKKVWNFIIYEKSMKFHNYDHNWKVWNFQLLHFSGQNSFSKVNREILSVLSESLSQNLSIAKNFFPKKIIFCCLVVKNESGIECAEVKNKAGIERMVGGNSERMRSLKFTWTMYGTSNLTKQVLYSPPHHRLFLNSNSSLHQISSLERLSPFLSGELV